MRLETEMIWLLEQPYKKIEAELNIKIRNGQTMEGIRKAFIWVMEGKDGI